MTSTLTASAVAQPGMFARLGALFNKTDPSSRAVLAGLLALWIALWIANPRFMTATNFNNLALQITAVSVIATGAVLVLLLGEIDLSLGSVSGACAAIMGVLSVQHGVPGIVAVLAAVAVGALIGLFQSLLITGFGVPAFVVTLGGLLAWQGLLLFVLGSDGSLNLSDPFILGLTSTYLPNGVTWTLYALVLAAVVAARVARRTNRRRLGLPNDGALELTVKLVLPAVLGGLALLVFTGYRGLPLAVVIVLGLTAIVGEVLRRSQLGRQIYAVGGNAEAARRAGISTAKVKMVVFATAAALAAFGGTLAASRLYAVNQSSGSSDLLLLAIAGPVIGGVSLFGGRGSVWFALVGSVLIGSISNGMDLLAIDSSIRFMVTGAVLVGAVIIDAVVRKRRAAMGR